MFLCCSGHRAAVWQALGRACYVHQQDNRVCHGETGRWRLQWQAGRLPIQVTRSFQIKLLRDWDLRGQDVRGVWRWSLPSGEGNQQEWIKGESMVSELPWDGHGQNLLGIIMSPHNTRADIVFAFDVCLSSPLSQICVQFVTLKTLEGFSNNMAWMFTTWRQLVEPQRYWPWLLSQGLSMASKVTW